MAAAKSEITLKLVIDTTANKVLFAEASKEFVDFLFFLLTLPIITVTKLLANDSLVGIVNLYKSFNNLDQSYLQPKIKKERLLQHVTSTSVPNASFLLGSSVTPSSVFYNKYSCDKNCDSDLDSDDDADCLKCGDLMTRENELWAGPNEEDFDESGYVQGLVPYMIYDDLSVKPMSLVSLMNELKISRSHINVEVKVGKKEALELLKFSLQSRNVLTNVFLRDKMKYVELEFPEKIVFEDCI